MCVCICVCARARALQFPPSPLCGFQGLNSGHQTCRAITLPTEPSCWPPDFLKRSLAEPGVYSFSQSDQAASSWVRLPVVLPGVEVTNVGTVPWRYLHAYWGSELRSLSLSNRHLSTKSSPQLTPPFLKIRSFHVPRLAPEVICSSG